MKFFLISDNVDTKMGMRFAGIEGVAGIGTPRHPCGDYRNAVHPPIRAS